MGAQPPTAERSRGPARRALVVVLTCFVGGLAFSTAGRSSVRPPGGTAPVPDRALPAMVVLLRHAEKPPTGEHLSAAGWARARALAPYLWNRYGAHLAAVYAAQVDPRQHSPSYRPQETLTPLIIKLLTDRAGVSVNTSWPVGQEALVAADITRHIGFAGKTVIIAWEHIHLPLIAAALGVPNPPAWPERFDLLMEISMTRRPPACRWVAQMRMPGDSATLPHGCGVP